MPARKTATAAAPAPAEDHGSFWEAFLAAQQEMPVIQKDKINPQFGSAYADLTSILPDVLTTIGRHGLAVAQLPSSLDGRPSLVTRIAHAKTGEFIEAEALLMLGGKETAQAVGSSITYMRRYAICAAFGIVTDKDDDGAAATKGRAYTPATPSENGTTSAASGAVAAVSGADGPAPWEL